MTRHIILRVRGRKPARHAGGTDVGFEDPAVSPEVQTEDLDERDVSDLADDPEVVATSRPMPVRLIEPLAADSDATGPSWGLDAIGATASSWSGKGVPVAVLDTGIDPNHSAFAGMALEQKDFSGKGDGDRHGHGTHCAGTFFGRDLDGQRIGVAPGIERALIGKVLDDKGQGTTEAVAAALSWAAAGSAKVVSMSLGFDFPGLVADRVRDGWPADLATSDALGMYRANLRLFDALLQLFRAHEAIDGGLVVVAAAGNESRRDQRPDYRIAVSLPAAAETVVSVGSLAPAGDSYTIAPSSNSQPVVSAPGVHIRSARAGGGMAIKSGTSMACPHVAGVAALWWEALWLSPTPARASTVIAKLLATARADRFSVDVRASDRGVGLVTCP